MMLSRELNYITNLKRLYISEAYIEDTGIIEFSLYLRNLNQLEELSISINEISDRGMNMLIKELKYCRNLKKIEINDNNINNYEIIKKEIKKIDLNDKIKVITVNSI